jgi:membrane-associated phospholipid phosphatase
VLEPWWVYNASHGIMSGFGMPVWLCLRRVMARFLKWVYVSAIAVGIVCTMLFYYMDRQIAWALHGLTDPVWLQASEYVTRLGTPKLWLAASLIGFLIAGLGYQIRKYTWQCGSLLYFGATNMLAIVVGSALKFILGRYRPIELFQDDLYGLHFFSMQWAQHSLPSGHALSVFAAATALSVLYRRYAPLFFFVAVLVAASRLVLNMHYLSDLILGAYIGIISGLAMRYALYKDKNIKLK